MARQSHATQERPIMPSMPLIAIVDDNDDRLTFMTTFSEAARDCQVRVYACCLMGTHYHTLLDTPRGNLSEFIRTLNTEYSKAFNRRHGRVGHTFEQRFQSLVVQREKYLRRVARYIALNPVKAHLCRDAAHWPWSTVRPRPATSTPVPPPCAQIPPLARQKERLTARPLQRSGSRA